MLQQDNQIRSVKTGVKLKLRLTLVKTFNICFKKAYMAS